MNLAIEEVAGTEEVAKRNAQERKSGERGGRMRRRVSGVRGGIKEESPG